MYDDKLFDDESLDKTSSYEDNSSERGLDGLFRIDLGKVSPENRSRGYRAVLRFLPNITKNPEYVKAYTGDKWNEDTETALGPAHYQKISHYLNIQHESMSRLKGFYDDPTNVNPKTQRPYTTEKWGPLAKTFFQLNKGNVLAKEKAKMIKYNNKYFSYVLVVEDEQQPELVGKIMILSYGKQIKDIIESERNGDTGAPCNIFRLHDGKDFVLLAKEKSFTNNEGKEVKAPDYTKSRFADVSPISIPIERDGVSQWKRVPLDDDGRIRPEHQEKIRNFLLARDIELESFAGQAWNEETQTRVSEAIDYLTGKTSGNNSSTTSPADDVEDFTFDDVTSEKVTSESSNDDDDSDIDMDF